MNFDVIAHVQIKNARRGDPSLLDTSLLFQSFRSRDPSLQHSGRAWAYDLGTQLERISTR
jgi:hypothetical protein